MLSLQDVKDTIDAMSPADRESLRNYLNQTTPTPELHPGTMDIDVLLAAAREIRADLTDNEWSEIEEAMNEKYIEQTDDDGFPML